MEQKASGGQTVALPCPPAVAGWASVVGKKEGDGPLADTFDLVSRTTPLGRRAGRRRRAPCRSWPCPRP